jgi:hypothetical protein
MVANCIRHRRCHHCAISGKWFRVGVVAAAVVPVVATTAVVVAVISEVDFTFHFNQSIVRLLQARHISARRLDVRARVVNSRCGD